VRGVGCTAPIQSAAEPQLIHIAHVMNNLANAQYLTQTAFRQGEHV
jgi:hypothetical protein